MYVVIWIPNSVNFPTQVNGPFNSIQAAENWIIKKDPNAEEVEEPGYLQWKSKGGRLFIEPVRRPF
ncbi:MAG: hypothetical protein COY69_02540 [Candidatus Magasanikbacteria bacterium CG_4_10_14_0_8_um_filter_32_14]|uniref:Uncharacterized protein n=2 Tax=Candidatus Magasanikiibacteriota TaxID=1752731 RepID=A0A2M7R9U8_9BACT|nr:MAG: hypothetical protein AUJ23_00490 [Candidatus Magasanikbacteria bacterium CG1_02_32_51]PIY93272.1 MAG: hypothetical protein COY69_02540 [Candidatus Magasanikbacteria bacterium CG_4_10_14_0_8_um_filter_32_14]